MGENDNGITAELIRDILDNVKLILNIQDDSKDTVLMLYINAICNNILIKTNRRIFIPDLKYIVIELVTDKYFINNSILNNADIQTIQSMSEAGRSVNFGISSIIGNKLNLLAQKQLEENDLLINKYKLLYKT